MGKNSDDYLDRLPDKGSYNYSGAGEFFIATRSPVAGLAISAARKAMQEQELAGLVDKSYFEDKRNELTYSNASALANGLFWVGLKKHKLLSSNAYYVSAGAKKLIDAKVAPYSNKVHTDISDAAIIDGSKSGSVFTVPNAVTLDASTAKELQPTDEKLLIPEVDHKVITVYTDKNIASCFVKNSLALVCFDDLIAFAGKKLKVSVNYGKGSVTYNAESIKLTMSAYKRINLSELLDKKANTRKPGIGEWQCPHCGKINQNYVGTCGCGLRKP